MTISGPGQSRIARATAALGDIDRHRLFGRGGSAGAPGRNRGPGRGHAGRRPHRACGHGRRAGLVRGDRVLGRPGARHAVRFVAGGAARLRGGHSRDPAWNQALIRVAGARRRRAWTPSRRARALAGRGPLPARRGHVPISRRPSARAFPAPVGGPLDLDTRPSTCSARCRAHAAVVRPCFRDKVAKARQVLATYADMEELIRLGAYRAGASAEVDEAVALMPQLEAFLGQRKEESTSMGDGYRCLEEILAVA